MKKLSLLVLLSSLLACETPAPEPIPACFPAPEPVPACFPAPPPAPVAPPSNDGPGFSIGTNGVPVIGNGVGLGFDGKLYIAPGGGIAFPL